MEFPEEVSPSMHELSWAHLLMMKCRQDAQDQISNIREEEASKYNEEVPNAPECCCAGR